MKVTGTVLLVILSISAIAWGIFSFDYNIFAKLIPAYAVWIYRIFGIVGGWVLYTTLKK